MKNNEENKAQNEASKEETNAQPTAGETTEETPVEEPLTEDSVLDEMIEKYNKLNDSHLRLMADFENYKKKTGKEKSDLIKYGGETIFINMLPIIDDFERAMAHMPEGDDPVKEGVRLIYSKFLKFLEQNGVKPIETQDAVFDTDFHEAVTMFPAADESQKGKIIDCTQKGYLFHDKVIRFAKVVVAQ